MRGQLAGLGMIVTPAVTHPLPLGGAVHATLQFVAVIIGAAGAAGAVVVFGGLFQRVWLQPFGTGAGDGLDDVLLAGAGDVGAAWLSRQPQLSRCSIRSS